MSKIKNGQQVTLAGLIVPAYKRANNNPCYYKIHHKSFEAGRAKGWIEPDGYLTVLTPAGKEALEG